VNKSIPKVIITGRTGYIASYLASCSFNNMAVLTTSCNCDGLSDCLCLDLQHPEKFGFGQITPQDIIIHLASISSPDVCTNNREYAYQVNVKGTCYFIEGCLKKGARVLFFSSDTVYGCTKAPFNEDSECNPVGEYGLMKYEVEKEFMRENRVKAFRLSYVFSRNDKFTQYLSKCANSNNIAEIFHPFYRSVVYLGDLLEAVIRMCTKWDFYPYNIVNICGVELISREDIAHLYKKIVSNNLKIKIVNPGESFFSARPESIFLVSKYFSKLLERKPKKIGTAITKEFIQ